MNLSKNSLLIMSPVGGLVRVIFFDGYCNLCNTFINWLIRHDHENILKFASLQGQTGVQRFGRNEKLNSVIYVRDEEVYKNSTAVLEILSDIGFPLTTILKLIPLFVRDTLYLLIARNRYCIFGTRDVCRLPTENEKTKFLS